VIEAAAGLCLSRTHYNIEVEHFLVKLLEVQDTDFDLIANYFGIDRSRLAAELSRSID
jgi:type VI secretion system protein VasG